MHRGPRLNAFFYAGAIEITVFLQQWLMVNVRFRAHDLIKDSSLFGSAWQIDVHQLCPEFLEGPQGMPKCILNFRIESFIEVDQRYTHVDVFDLSRQILQTIVAADRIQKDGNVLNGARHRSGMVKCPRQRDRSGETHTTVGRFQTDDAAHRSGNPNRTT